MRRMFTRKPVTASINQKDIVTSQCSFDFLYDTDYDEELVELAVEKAFEDTLGHEIEGIDIHSVDYSDIPEYADSDVSQCTVDFNHLGDYDSTAIVSALGDEMSQYDYSVIGVDFYAV